MRLMSGNNAFQQGNGLDMQYLNTPTVAISTLVARLCRRTVRKAVPFRTNLFRSFEAMPRGGVASGIY